MTTNYREFVPKIRPDKKSERIVRKFLEGILISSFFFHQGMSLKFGKKILDPLRRFAEQCKSAVFFFVTNFVEDSNTPTWSE